MKTSLFFAVLPALVLSVAADAREHSPIASPVDGPASAGVSDPALSDNDLVGAHPMIFNAGDARVALARAFAKRRHGKVEFSLRGAGIDRDIAADCDVTASRSSTNRAMPMLSPSAITCRFHEAGRSLPARLILEEMHSPSGSDMDFAVRQGQLRIDGLELQIAAWDSSGEAQPATSRPSVYLFTIDGATVGSVELAARPLVRFVAGKDERTRRAVMLGATALGVLWSPQSTNPAVLADQPVIR